MFVTFFGDTWDQEVLLANAMSKNLMQHDEYMLIHHVFNTEYSDSNVPWGKDPATRDLFRNNILVGTNSVIGNSNLELQIYNSFPASYRELAVNLGIDSLGSVCLLRIDFHISQY